MSRQVDIAKYYPNIMKEVREFKWIATVENPELLLLWGTLGEVLSNQFIADLLVSGAERWETILKIRAKDTDTMEIRRARILAKINEDIPYTHRSLEQKLTAIYGENMTTVDIDYSRYAVSVTLDLSMMPNITTVDRLLQVIIPANLTKKIRFERPVRETICIGQTIRTGKKMTIHAVTSFSLNKIDGTNQYGFATRTAKQIMIKAVV